MAAVQRLTETDPSLLRLPETDAFRVEDVIAAIWAKVLDIRDIADDDDFFELGGDSLDAALILARVQDRFQIGVRPEDFFRARTVANLCRLLEKTPPPAVSRSTEFRRVADRHEFPATSSQRRLWFLDRFIARPEVYNVYRLLRLHGPVDVGALGKAMADLANRHEPLRTRFREEDGVPVQVVEPSVAVELQFADISALPLAERFPVVRREAEADTATPFDLRVAPLLRVRLWKVDEGDFFLLVNQHHTVTDGWSVNRFLGDLAEYYGAGIRGETSKLSILPVQFGDCAVREGEWIGSADYREKLDFWRRELTPLPPTLDLPFARPRPKAQSFGGGVSHFDLSAAMTARIDALGREANATRFMVGLTAFLAVLHRYTGLTDLTVGTPVANRNRPETEELLGFFVNTVVLRNRIAGGNSFREALATVADTTLRALGHGEIPFEAVVEELKPERDTSRQPLFQIVFQYHNQGGVPSAFGPHDLIEVPLHNGTAMFDLRLILRDTIGGGLGGRIEYNAKLFDRPSIERMAGHFATLLDGALTGPDTAIERLPLLAGDERRQVLEAFNPAPAPGPPACKIHELFERRASEQPDAPALIAAGETWSYRRLNGEANRLAHYLRAQGLRPGDFAAVALPRTPLMVAAVLAVGKAGAAYVPLDPGYPAERLGFMLADCGAKFAITLSALRDRLPPTSARLIECDLVDLSGQPAENPEPVGSTDDPAYVIYTSGSTGTPKGVLLRHGPAVNTLDWVNGTFGVGPRDRLLFTTSLGFDLSVYDIFGVLGAGGSLRIASEAELRDPQHLLKILRDEPITIWNSAPAALQQLLPFFPQGRCSSPLRLVLLSGDWIPVGLPDRVKSAFGEARVIGLGGATEAAIWSNWYPIGEVDPTWPSIPYGRPIRNARYHILDGQLQPQPVGVPGELHIGGPVLADGYLNRAALTAERFIPDPFSGSDEHRQLTLAAHLSARLYKTGDLARYFPDGTIEFLGRLDHQVKLRGYRVEIGEIEAVLNRHPDVQAAVVRPVRDGDGQVALVAFVEPRGGAGVNGASLGAHLAAALPDYMVPGRFVPVAEWPVTPNGKLDRAALVAPERAHSAAAAFEPPNDVLEEVVAAVFAEVLRVGRIGRRDNFFELGGHSLKAALVVARLGERCGVDLRLPALFDRPTVAGLADAVREMRGRAKSLPALAPAARNDRLSPMQRRFWYLDRLLPNRAVYNVADVYRLAGPIDRARLERAWAAVLERHGILRANIPAGDGEPRLAIRDQMPAAIAFEDLSDLDPAGAADALQRRLAAEAEEPFDLANGPLWRLRLIRLSDSAHLLAVTIHHIAMDESSRGPLLSDWAAAYAAEAALPPLEISYADYSAWLWDWLTAETLRDQLDFWKRQLADCPPALALPTDRAAPAASSFTGGTVAIAGGAALRTLLRNFGRASGTTPFMIALTAFQALMSRLCSQDDICVGTPITLRHSPAAHPLVGCFVNTLPIRARFAAGTTFQNALLQIRSTTLAAFANADVPFEKIVEALAPERTPGQQPYVQTMFVHSSERPRGENGAFAWSLDRVTTVGSKFDLRFGTDDTGDGFDLKIEYSDELWDRATVERLGRAYLHFLGAALERPELEIARIPLVDAAECEREIRQFAGPTRPFPENRTIAELVEDAVGRTPHSTAFESGGVGLSYAEWNDRANRLAGYLIERGVGADTLVGICVDRTLDLPIAMLAVIKAGGAYVPLEPHYPAERLALYIRDCRMPVLITRTELLGKLTPADAQAICLDRDAGKIALHSGENRPPRGRPDSAFYVIYTSGSTGRPNGVAIENRNAVNLLDWMAAEPEFAASDTVLAVSTTSFDIHVLDYWLPALKGMRVVLAPRSAAADGAELRAALATHKVTLMSVTPATWRLLSAAGWQGTPGLKAICGGEAMSAELASELLGKAQAVWNIYGPTETTVFSAFHRVTESRSAPPIGRPVANTRIAIRDALGQPVLHGCSGEIAIAGAGVGRGYIGRAELTAARFAEDPSVPGGRMYRTGDLGRRRADGTIECLGRLDFQVKVRGFRIELGEIERRLGEHTDIAQAVVLARPDPVGGSALHAYCVAKTGLAKRPTPAHLKEYLAAQVPDHMVPASFTWLDRFPVSPNGKVDRAALPEPEPSARAAEGEFAPPTDALEAEIQAAWHELFGFRPIGATANFFELGGHSLQAAYLMAKIENRYGIRLPLEALFGSPTIRGLTNRVRRRLPDRITFTTVPENPAAPATDTPREDAHLPTEYVAPIGDEETALQAIWQEVLQVKPVGATDDFYDLGGDSVHAAVLMNRIEQRLGHRLTLEALFEAPTVRGLAKVIQKDLELGTGVLVPLQAAGSKPPLFLIAGAGGHVFAFHKFARLLGEDQPSYGMKAIGVDGTEEPLAEIRAIAERYVREILAARPDGPYVVAGYSVGGTIALEVGLQLQALGKKVSRVIAFDTLAPGYPRPMPFWKRLRTHADNFVKLRGRLRAEYLAQRMDQIRKRVLYTLNLHRLYAPPIPGMNVVPQDTLKRVWGALYKAREAYWPSGRYDGPVVLVSSEKAVQWVGHYYDDPQKGWARWCTGGVQIFTVPAAHMDFFKDDNIDRLAGQIRSVMDEVAGEEMSAESARPLG